MPFHIGVLAVVLTLIGPSPGRAQEEPAKSNAATDAFFSGNVVDIGADQVTVSRTVLSKPPEKQTFKITAATKIEGKMKQKSRVTVRYAPSDEGNVALSIIVRADKTDGKKK